MHQTHRVLLIGKGEIEDLLNTLGWNYEQIKELDAAEENSIVVIDTNIPPGKKAVMERKHKVKILDRFDIILEIFKEHASPLGKLQLKLAELQRIYAISSDTARLKIRRKIKLIKNKINRIQKTKVDPYLKLREQGFYIIPLVGYSNSGKSSLFNFLIKKEKAEIKDELFTTSITRCGLVDIGVKTVFVDTVGFIKNVPKELIPAFKDTLDVMRYADLILHLIDGSDKNWKDKLETGKEIIKRYTNSPVITVVNKIDKGCFAKGDVYISVKKHKLNGLVEKITEALDISKTTIKLEYSKLPVLNKIPHSLSKTIKKGDSFFELELRGKKELVEQFIRKYVLTNQF